MDLDNFKQAWHEVDHRLAKQEELGFELIRAARVSRVSDRLRPLALGQVALIAVGVSIALWGGDFWFSHRQIWQAAVPGAFMQVFGVLSIVIPARTLGFIYGVNYADPVIETQRRVARLKLWRVQVEARIFGVLGSVIWIPALLMLVQYHMDGSGVNDWGSVTSSLVWTLFYSAISLGIVGLIYLAAIKIGWGQRLEASFAGDAIARAEAELEQLARFGRE